MGFVVYTGIWIAAIAVALLLAATAALGASVPWHLPLLVALGSDLRVVLLLTVVALLSLIHPWLKDVPGVKPLYIALS